MGSIAIMLRGVYWSAVAGLTVLVFVVGELMRLGDLPGVAEVAMQTGGHAAKTIMRACARRFDSASNVCAIGTWRARFSYKYMLSDAMITVPLTEKAMILTRSHSGAAAAT